MSLAGYIDRQVLLQMKLENYRKNRQRCPASQRLGFDQLIATAQAELNHITKADPRPPAQSQAGAAYARSRHLRSRILGDAATA